MQQPTSEARPLTWAPLWEDEPDPWWVLGPSGQVLACNRAARAFGDAPGLPEESYVEMQRAGVWRGELGAPHRAAIALRSDEHVMLTLPAGGPARGDLLRQVLDISASALIGVEQGRILYRSAGARRWAGRELLGEPSRSALPPALRGVLAGHGPPPDAALETASALRRLSWRRVLLGSNSNGPALLVGLDPAPAPAPADVQRPDAGQIASVRLTAIGEMAAGVAHELNQPLNVITGYIELLQDGGGNREDIARALEVMSRAAERMATLVSHLRDYTRAGLETLRPVDLRDVLRNADELSSRAVRPPVPLAWSSPAEPHYVLGDPGRLEQLFINLLANARQATGAHGGRRVELRMYATEDAHETASLRRPVIAVEVRDQGPGVPTSMRERIFEPFFTTKGREGTGLGLSICERIAREHQGRIQVEDAPGGGALFRVLLPRYAPL